MSERYTAQDMEYFEGRRDYNIKDPISVLENASFIAKQVNHTFSDMDRMELDMFRRLSSDYKSAQIGLKSITQRIQELPRNSDGTLDASAQKQYQELTKMLANSQEYVEPYRKRFYEFSEKSNLVRVLQRKHKEQRKPQKQNPQATTEAKPQNNMPENKTRFSKRGIIIAVVTIVLLLVSGYALLKGAYNMDSNMANHMLTTLAGIFIFINLLIRVPVRIALKFKRGNTVLSYIEWIAMIASGIVLVMLMICAFRAGKIEEEIAVAAMILFGGLTLLLSYPLIVSFIKKITDKNL